MKRERKKELNQRLRYLAAGLIESTELCITGAFDDCTNEEWKWLEIQQEKLGKKIYPDGE